MVHEKHEKYLNSKNDAQSYLGAYIEKKNA